MTEKFISFDNVDGVNATQGAYNATSNPGGTGSLQQANGTWVYTAAPGKFEGTTGVKVTVASATTTISRFTPIANNTALEVSYAFRIDQLPSKTFHVFGSARNSGGVAARIILDMQGRICVRGTGVTTPEVTSTQTIQTGKWYYVTIILNAASNSFQVTVYDGTTREKVLTVVNTNNVVSIGTTAFNGFDIGWANSDPVSGQVAYFDSFSIDDGRTTERMPDSWKNISLAGQTWDGASIQNGTLRSWEGSAFQELSAVTIS